MSTEKLPTGEVAKPPTTVGVKSVVVIAGLGFCAGIGVGIGIGAGIWKGDCGDTASFLPSGACDASVGHDDGLITYVLTINDFVIQRDPENSEFVEVTVPKESLPSVMPYLLNDAQNGALYQDVLNTTMFLEDWSTLSLQANETAGEFAMPGYAAAKQCYSEYEVDATSSSVPPNAMVIRHDEQNVERLVHVYSVTEEPESFVFRLLPVIDENPRIMQEGQCHPYQSMSDPHFHHVSTCLEYDANWIVGQNATEGSGLTAFIKLGPLIDTGLVAVGTDLIASAGADAAVDAGADAVVDAGADAASDAGADAASDASGGTEMEAGYDGDDIVSDGGSSDGASDRADTMIGEEPRGGGGPGFGTAVTVAGGGVGTASVIGAAEAPQADGGQ